jgi:hypothetical protein
MNEEIKNKIISAVKEQKITIIELASKLYMSERQLKLLLKEWGVEIPGTRKRRIVEKPPREELMKIYNEKGNLTDVAEYYKIGVNTVGRWMKSLNIPTRKLVMSDEEKKDLLEKHIGLLKDIEL